MIIAGSVYNVEEKEEIMLVAKTFLIGQRAQKLSQIARRKNENNNKKKNK